MSLHDTAASSLSLVDETALDTDDIVLTTAEGDNYHHKVIRRLAANATSDCIDGKSNQLEMKAYFVQQYTLSDFE